MTPETPDETARAPKLDDIFTALSHSTRRHVLSTIGERNPRTSGELEPEELVGSEDERERYRLELYHNHLPSLDAAGFIDWDSETDSITRGPRYDEIRPVIRLMDDHRDVLPGDWP